MTETTAIAQADVPRTRQSLADDLRVLGVQAGDVLLVHTSLSALGWVSGGAVAVIQALQDVLTPAGTLVMPAFSGDLTDPAGWQRPPVPETWWPIIRESMPAFDPLLTPSRAVGRTAELFRTWPDVQRSNHPQSSFAAWGRHAAQITANHALEYSLGEGSPLARIYELGGRVLLLGTNRNSSLHLAEARAGLRQTVQMGAPLLVNGVRQWVTFAEWDYDDDTFPPVKAAFEGSGAVKVGQVGSARAQLMSQPALVDFAVAYWQNEKARA